ncbi:hypothetical protein ACFOPN_05445 [Xanthomonas hyacinthi]|uniref:hypothetical protein n=1 Tax=Xanthomonas hyacinthi TaxID=56455 RepID=UPI00065963B8|nr:hypothetical protein Y886_03855 [Xanthomonas hyacinthi DSM 19077]
MPRRPPAPDLVEHRRIGIAVVDELGEAAVFHLRHVEVDVVAAHRIAGDVVRTQPLLELGIDATDVGLDRRVRLVAVEAAARDDDGIGRNGGHAAGPLAAGSESVRRA